MAAMDDLLPISLLDLLSNYLILRHTSPYIGIRALLSLAATSKAYKSLVYDTPQVFQYVNLSETKFLGVTHDVWIGGQGRTELYTQRFDTVLSILENRNLIQNVKTLVLDKLYVPTTVIEDVLSNERYQIRLLSVRNIYGPRIKDLVYTLRRVLKPSHPKGMPKLRGLYVFGQPNNSQDLANLYDATFRQEVVGITASIGAQLGAGNHVAYGPDDFRKRLGIDPYSDSPYGVMGISSSLERWPGIESDWPEFLEACIGVIHFDAVLCRHNRESVSDPESRLATVRLAGCKSCGTCPEGPAYPGSPADHLPLLSPPPLHSSKIEVAQRIEPNGQPYPALIVRCPACLKGRWCERCNVWWCESCYTIPKNRTPAKGDASSTVSGPTSNEDIKVHNGLCVSNCLMSELLNGVGEGGMWG